MKYADAELDAFIEGDFADPSVHTIVEVAAELAADLRATRDAVAGLLGSALAERCDRLRADLDDALATIARKDEVIEQMRRALAAVKP